MITDKDVNDFLVHRGVKGMKWGQRRAAKAQSKAQYKMKKASRTHDDISSDRAAVAIGVGAGYIATRLLGKKTGMGIALVGGTAAGIAGARFTKSLIERDRIYTSQLAGE